MELSKASSLTFEHQIFYLLQDDDVYMYIYIYIYLGKLKYFTNLNSSAIWGSFPLLTMISSEVAT